MKLSNIVIGRKRIYCKTRDEFMLILFLMKGTYEEVVRWKGYIHDKDGNIVGKYEYVSRGLRKGYWIWLKQEYIDYFKRILPHIRIEEMNEPIIKGRKFIEAWKIYYEDIELGIIAFNPYEYVFFYKK